MSAGYNTNIWTEILCSLSYGFIDLSNCASVQYCNRAAANSRNSMMHRPTAFAPGPQMQMVVLSQTVPLTSRLFSPVLS